MTVEATPPDAATEPKAPAQEHPIDRALTALGEATAALLTSGRRSRFAEAQALASLAHKLQQLRPAAGVDDAGPDNEDEGDGNVIGEPYAVMPARRMANPGRRVGYNDAVDLNREIIMIAQGFLKSYMETEKLKAGKPLPETRITAVLELADLMRLRMQLMKEAQDVPVEINARIDQLLQRVGAPTDEPTDEPRPDPVVSTLAIRRHPPDGAGELDGDRVGEAVAG